MRYTVNVEPITVPDRGIEFASHRVAVAVYDDNDNLLAEGSRNVVTADAAVAENNGLVFISDLRTNDSRLAGLELPIDPEPEPEPDPLLDPEAGV
jgi:hypothetical protein